MVGFSNAQTIVSQQNGRFRICKGSITDSDKAANKSDYEHNENSTMILSIPGAKSITLKFSSFCTEKDNDILRVFDGKDTNATLIGKWSGNIGPTTISSTDSFITLHFKSDKSISCTGWKAQVLVQIIKPTPFKFNQSASGTSLPNCKDSIIKIATDFAIPCDSMNLGNTSISGPNSPTISKIKAINCSNGKSQLFEFTIPKGLTLNGLYKISHTHGYKDYCDSTYFIQSLYNFSISNCPILVKLTADQDTICKGSCIKLTLKATGGDSTKYKYTWFPLSLSGKGPFTQCLNSNRTYTVKVEDGTSIPGLDTIDIIVLDPPKAQQDTTICYYSPNIYLRATPAGGNWRGSGIINSKTGEFKPNSVWGPVKVWYQVGSCADTVLVTVTAPYNYENVFCPTKTSYPLYWYGPADGTWTGKKVTPAGQFTPDSIGTYTLTYTWKGCVSSKTVFVQNIQVKKRDTVCESSTAETLIFSPKGLYPNWFPGLTNYYYGSYNPSQMGGPKNYNIIFAAQGGCRDTTILTVLSSDAGLNDTFCPNAGIQPLKAFRPNANYTWKSKGINGVGSAYNPSWWSATSKSNIDTLELKTAKCIDKKYVHILPVKVLLPDTLFYCKEDTTTTFSSKGVTLSVPGGKWFGAGVVKNMAFDPRISGIGTHYVRYSHKGCEDTLIVIVRSKPIIQLDTSICFISSNLNIFQKEKNGLFWGAGVVSPTGIFSPTKAGFGSHIINYKSSAGCLNSLSIQVDSVPKIIFNFPTFYCSKDSLFGLKAKPYGGKWFGLGVIDSSFNPQKAGEGNHTILYGLNINACSTKDSIGITVNSPLKLTLSPKTDSVCYGKILTLNAKVSGGIVSSQSLRWSHGQQGNKTYYTANQSGKLITTATDGCSDAVFDTANIIVQPRIWSIVSTSDTVCRGKMGWAKVVLGNKNPARLDWAHDSKYKKDTLFAPSDNRYRVNLTDLITGCFGDTTVEIPGYKAIQAGFVIQKQTNDMCLTPLDQTALFFNQSIGGTSGNWHWGDGSFTSFSPIVNPTHFFDGLKLNYEVMLAIQNEGGCTDTISQEICYNDTVILHIPNAFTPNGDGINDKLECAIWGSSDFELNIYNRWGQIVFKSKDKNEHWDGTINGINCPEGVYAVLVEYKGNRQARRIAKSSVTLLRPKLY